MEKTTRTAEAQATIHKHIDDALAVASAEFNTLRDELLAAWGRVLTTPATTRPLLAELDAKLAAVTALITALSEAHSMVDGIDLGRSAATAEYVDPLTIRDTAGRAALARLQTLPHMSA
jgi:hypothetical protein